MRYCPECGEEIEGTPKFCPQCGEELSKENITEEKKIFSEKSEKDGLAIKQAKTTWDTWNKKQEKEKPKMGYIVLGIIGFIIICVIMVIAANNLVPGGGQNPRVTMENCYTSNGQDSSGSYVNFEVTVKNIGDGWAVGTYAQIQVKDQSGNIQYTNDIISIGSHNLDGSWRPMEVGEQQIFSFKSPYTSSDSSLTASITLYWDNKAGSRFNQHFSKTVNV